MRGETDIAAIERAMNLVLTQLRSRADKAEAVTSRLEEELLQSRNLEAIGTLAAGIAHEINTPLQFILSNLTFLEQQLERGSRGAEMDELAPCLAESMEGVQHIAGIVRAMNVFSPRGDEQIMKPININEAIESVVEVSRSVWKHAARCEMALEPCLPEVTCFAGEIKQVLMNLMFNAVDAIKSKRAAEGDDALGQICIRTHSRDHSIVVTISDTGCGVRPEIRKRVFEPFFTTDETRSHRGQGLTLAYASVVKVHGGKLAFRGLAEGGTIFRARIPIRQPNATENGANDE